MIPLYPVASTREGAAFTYVSESLGALAGDVVAVQPEKIALRNWTCRWSVLRADGELEALDQAGPMPGAGETDRFLVRVDYTGSLELTEAQRHAVAPRVLFLPALRSPGELVKTSQGPLGTARNVLIVMIDTLRQDHTAAYGHGHALTPHLDLVRCVGARFDDAYATSSSTRPSVGSLMTGYYPLAHGSVRSGTTPAVIHPGAPRLAERFHGSGYKTGGFYANGQVAASCGFGVGFDTYEGPIWDAELTQRALEWLDEVSQPWFLYVHYIAPHHPYEPPEPYDSIFTGLTGDNEHDRYLGEIAVEDRRVGELLAGVAERGAWNDTLIWIVSDHGEEFWEHGWKWHGASLYDEVVRVVSLVSCPWLTPSGLTIAAPESLLDMPETLYEIFAMPDEPEGQGESLAGLLAGGDSVTLATRTLYMQLYAGTKPEPHHGDRQAVLRDGVKSIWKTTVDEYERYNMGSDPGETDNLWIQPDAPREEILEELRAFVFECESIADRFKQQEDVGLPTMRPEDIESIEALGYR